MRRTKEDLAIKNMKEAVTILAMENRKLAEELISLRRASRDKEPGGSVQAALVPPVMMAVIDSSVKGTLENARSLVESKGSRKEIIRLIDNALSILFPDGFAAKGE